jgi:Tfp pilus assembly protein PilF
MACRPEISGIEKGTMMKTLRLVVMALVMVPVDFAQVTSGDATPAQQKIAWAEAAIRTHGDHCQPYNDLAVAYVRRARETGDDSNYSQAELALKKSFQITPDNLEGQKARLMILLGRGEFTTALELAKALNKKTPDDVLVYGLMADSAIELGNYNDAENAVQWMLDMRPGNVSALLRGARLRWLFGDAEGAMDFYSQAYQQIPPTQKEDLAWTLTQMADLQLSIGHLDDARRLLHSALEKFPGYYLALESQASVQIAARHPLEAEQLLRHRNEHFPSPTSRYALAKALEESGKVAESNSVYAAFEQEARRLIDAPDNANQELVLYYLGHGKDPAEALRIARIETTKRHDVNTLDVYAWALSSNGQYVEAQREIAAALAVGVREAAMLYHAGVISAKLNDNASAAKYLKASIAIDSTSKTGTAAREALDRLTPALAAARNVK